MTFEERLQYHEQWLLSMESNHSQISADLAAVVRQQAAWAEEQTRQAREQTRLAKEQRRLAEEQRRLAEGQAQLTEALVQLTQVVLRIGERQAVTEASLAALADQHRRLEELVEQFIRFRSDGGPRS